MADAKRDANRVPTLIGVSNADFTTPILVGVDSATNRLLTSSLTTLPNLEVAEDVEHSSGDTGIMSLAVRNDAGSALAADGDYHPFLVNSSGALYVTGGGGGIEYTEGDTDASFTGSISLAEGPSNTATPLQVDASKLLQVDIAADSVGIGGGTQYTEGTTDATITGNAMLAEAPSDTLEALQVDASKHLQVDIAAVSVGIGGGTQYTEGDTDATIVGTAMLWEDGSDTLRAISAAKPLPVAEQGDFMLGSDFSNVLGSASLISGTPAIKVEEQNVISIANDNKISTDNSTTTPINSGLTYTGTGEDVSDYSSITVQLDSSHNSATDGMTFEFSTDDTNWDDTHLFTYTAADGGRRFQFPVHAQYFRVKYTNGGTNQTTFRVQTILHRQALLTSIHRIVDDTNPDRSAQIIKSAIIAQKGGGGPGAGDFVAVQSTAAGNLKMSVQEVSDGLDIGAGNAAAETQRVILASDQNFVHLEDVQHSSGDAGIMALAVENEDQADLSTGDKDYTPIAVTKEGNVIVKQEGTITVTESSPISGFATSSNQLADGHAVTIDNISSNEVFIRGSQNAGSPVDGEVVTIQGIAGADAVIVDSELPAATALADNMSNPTTPLIGSALMVWDGSAWDRLGGSGATGIKVDVAANSIGLATSAKQLADGHNVTIDNISTNEVFIRGGGTAGSATNGEVVAVQGIASGTAMAVTESSPISGFATSSNQLADGHNVTVDNAIGAGVYIRPGTSAVFSVNDNSSSLTVDTTGTSGLEVVQDTAADLKMTEASASDIKTAVEAIDGAIIGPGEPAIDSYTHKSINLTTGANQVLVASSANKQIWVYGIVYTCSVDGTVSFQDEDDTAVTGIMDHAANSGLSHPASGNFAMPIWKLGTDKDLEVDVLLADIDGWLDYAIVSV